jgi:hypothetical protein
MLPFRSLVLNQFVGSSSPEEAYDSAVLGTQGEEASFLASLQGIGVEEKLENLKAYFLEPYYPMFVSLFHLYEEVGGDVISLAEPLLSEATRKESAGDALDKIRVRYVGQFIALWLLSGAVLVSVRIGLAGFYAELSRSPVYLLIAELISPSPLLPGCILRRFAAGKNGN